MSRSILLLFLFALASCHSSSSLQGNWSVDVDATINRAKVSGLSNSAALGIQEIYGGGLLEITSDTLIMRIDGIPDAISRNYEVVDRVGDCYNLKITNTSGTHNYCIEGGALVVRDPSAKIAVVYSGQ